MTNARRLYRLQLALALGGAAAVAAGVAVAARAISLDPPSAAALLAACRTFALPDLDTASLPLLGVGSLSFAALALAARSAVGQLRARSRFLSSLEPLAAAPVGPPGTLLIDDQRPQAFCSGLVRPRVYLSRGALDALAPAELDAVLAHEAHHAHRRDPLRLFLAQMLADGLFFLPALRRLTDRYEALAELAADEAAVRASGDARPLAGALLAFDRPPAAAIVGIAPERVDHLLGRRPGWELPLIALAGSATAALAGLAVAVRLTDAAAQTTINLPLVAAQACMLVMAILPLVAGAFMLATSRRLARGSRS